MDNQNILNFLSSQSRYDTQQQQFFYKKPFNSFKEYKQCMELHGIDQDLSLLQEEDDNYMIRLSMLKRQQVQLTLQEKLIGSMGSSKNEFSDYANQMSEQPIQKVHQVERKSFIQNSCQTPRDQAKRELWNFELSSGPLSARENAQQKLAYLNQLCLITPSKQKRPNSYVVKITDEEPSKVVSSLLSIGCREIEILEISNSKLKEIPDALFLLHKLQKLNGKIIILTDKGIYSYRDNCLSICHQKSSLFEIIFQIQLNPLLTISKGEIKSSILMWDQSIQHLDVSSNKIKAIDESIGYLYNLKGLYIQSNEFTSLPKSLGKLQSLNEINLDWFRYCNPPLSTLQTKIQTVQKLIDALKRDDLNILHFISLFSSGGVDLNRVDLSGRNLIHIAALEQDLGVLNVLLETSPKNKINQLDFEVLTLCLQNQFQVQCPLSLAMKSECLFSSRILLLNGANPNLGLFKEGSLLSYTIFNQLLPITHMILRQKDCMDAIFKTDNDGNGPLHYLSLSYIEPSQESDFRQISEYMIKQGIYYAPWNNERNKQGWSMIHLAVIKNRPQLIKNIISVNNEIILKNLPCKQYDINQPGGLLFLTPIELAISNELLEISIIFLENTHENLMNFTPRLSRMCKTNYIILKILHSYERQWKIWYLNSLQEQNMNKNINKLADSSKNQIKLMSSLQRMHDQNSIICDDITIQPQQSSVSNISKNSNTISRLGNIIFNAPTHPQNNLHNSPSGVNSYDIESFIITQDSSYSQKIQLKYIHLLRTFVVSLQINCKETKNDQINKLSERVKEYPRLLLNNNDNSLQLAILFELLCLQTFSILKKYEKDLIVVQQQLRKSILNILKNYIGNQDEKVPSDKYRFSILQTTISELIFISRVYQKPIINKKVADQLNPLFLYENFQAEEYNKTFFQKQLLG